MPVYQTRLLAIGSLLALAACNQQPKQAEVPVNNWMAEPFAQSPQVLLTNAAAFTDGQRLDGASAFLVAGGTQRYAVTAKHLLGEDGGIEPKKLPSQLNAELESWRLFARRQAPDTVQLGKLLNVVDADSSDALVFSLQPAASAYQALIPRYDPPAKGEEVYLVGCPYAEPDCTQNRYPVRVVEASPTEYLLTKLDGLDYQGFSGCPVVDQQGRVIGLLSFSVEYQNGEKYSLITPIGVVAQYLKK